jgi:hypothetical protein
LNEPDHVLVIALADMNPAHEMTGGATGFVDCFFCEAGLGNTWDPQRNAESTEGDHEPDCLWVRARRATGGS